MLIRYEIIVSVIIYLLIMLVIGYYGYKKQ